MPRIRNRVKNVFRDPVIMPRIGDEYQAKLPRLICNPFGESKIKPRIGDKYQVELPQLRETMDDSNLHFLVGLPVSFTCPRTCLDLNTSDVDSGYRFVPGLDEENWSGAERDCFLLGLYIFNKDFVRVRRFVETKEIWVILSYYFRKFHSSSEYYRWCGYRKKKFDKRMFSGLMQQEFESRVLPRLVVECREALLDVSTLFGDKKISLVDYAVSLKAIVGIDILVDTVVSRVHPDCSSLSPSQIIRLLREHHRLSKARSIDFFWTAVWPRLQARGWRLEQPRNYGYGGKGSLVFLTPAIKKLCRKKLVKGDQYFDSMAEVFSRVAQDPGLIGLDSEDKSRPFDASSSSNEHLLPRVSTHPSASEDPRLHKLFDLNLPYPDSEDVLEMTSNEAEDFPLTLDLEIGDDVNQRRHSTRTRRTTTRLIHDATHAHDMVKLSNKRKEASGDGDQSRLSQRVRLSVERLAVSNEPKPVHWVNNFN